MICFRVFSKTKGLCKNIRQIHFEEFPVVPILGIETSCDETGCAVVDTKHRVLGAALNSQYLFHLNLGGIIPPIAQDLHRRNIQEVHEQAMSKAGVSMEDIAAVAVTVKPGLPLSLAVGTTYGKYLCDKYCKPFIPIHHMQAHALTARLNRHDLEFPFLVLLISGGHSLLAIAEGVNKFWLLGTSFDNAAGEVFDKVARRLKLRNLPEYSELTGGGAIELAASRSKNRDRYPIYEPLLQQKNCMFSFSGLKTQFVNQIAKEEKTYDVPPDEPIPYYEDFSASLLLSVTKHVCRRVQRAMEFAKVTNRIPASHQRLVVSGGVACNDYIYDNLQRVCEEMQYELIRPLPKLCTDNGVMIAWNGVEKWRERLDIVDYQNLHEIVYEKECPIGPSLVDDVQEAQLSCKWVKIPATM